MDYKYINQLLERYFECQTTLEEENILKTFFCQDDVPASLLRYREIFQYEQTEPQEDQLGDDFDAKMLQLVEEETVVKARRITLFSRFQPILKAAAMVAMIITVGNTIQMSMNFDEDETPVEQGYVIDGRGSSAVKIDSLRSDSLQRSHIETSRIRTVDLFMK